MPGRLSSVLGAHTLTLRRIRAAPKEVLGRMSSTSVLLSAGSLVELAALLELDPPGEELRDARLRRGWFHVPSTPELAWLLELAPCDEVDEPPELLEERSMAR